MVQGVVEVDGGDGVGRISAAAQGLHCGENVERIVN